MIIHPGLNYYIDVKYFSTVIVVQWLELAVCQGWGEVMVFSSLKQLT